MPERNPFLELVGLFIFGVNWSIALSRARVFLKEALNDSKFAIKSEALVSWALSVSSVEFSSLSFVLSL
jgi:hypothetical protein